MIQILRNTLSTIALAGAISFMLPVGAQAQGLKTNQGSFGSGWQVGGSSSDTSPYSGSTSGSNLPPGAGAPGGSGYGSGTANDGGSGRYGGTPSYGRPSDSYGSTGSTSSPGSGSVTGSAPASRPAGGGLRVQ